MTDPAPFEFLDTDGADDGVVAVRVSERRPHDPTVASGSNRWSPQYRFSIHWSGHDEPIGWVRPAITDDHEEVLQTVGHIGFTVDEVHRGWGVAPRATRLVLPFARAHGLTRLVLGVEPGNDASLRVMAKLGCIDDGVHEVPRHHDTYHIGVHRIHRFLLDIPPA